MTTQADSTAVALDSSANDETSKSNVVYLSKRDLEEKQNDVELTVLSGYAYELDAPNEAAVAKSENVIKISEEEFAVGRSSKKKPEESAEEFYRRATAKGKLDAGRTVRSELAFDFDSTAPVSPRDAARAAGIKAELGDEPLHGIENQYAYRFVKRAFDVVFSAAVIAAFSWLYLIIAIAVKVDDPKGPVFFKQKRVGWSIIGQKSGTASVSALRPALSALKVFSASHSRLRSGVAA